MSGLPTTRGVDHRANAAWLLVTNPDPSQSIGDPFPASLPLAVQLYFRDVRSA